MPAANAAVTSAPLPVRTDVTPAISVAFQVLPSSALLSSAPALLGLAFEPAPDEHPEPTSAASAKSAAAAIDSALRCEQRVTVNLGVGVV